jgi:phage gpG-like protein
VSFQIIQDTISPGLARMIAASRNPKAVLEAMALHLASLTKRAFSDASLRPAPWETVKKAKGSPLRASGALWQSIRVLGCTNTEAKVGTDRPYAQWHQFGTKPYDIRPKNKKALAWPGGPGPRKVVHHPGLPPRPFFPFDSSGNLIPTARASMERVAENKLRKMLPPASGT